VDFDSDIVAVYFRLIRIAERYYYHDERAYDLAAEAVCRAIEARDRYDGRRPLLTWCRAIMRNLWRNSMQKLSTTHTTRLGEWDEPDSVEADQMARVDEVLTVLRDLQSRSVAVDTLVEYAKGYSIAEIAADRGVPVGTVKRRIHDARRMLSIVIKS
jgi:RNA polymerase sigma-70 factor (ECF subfamily)